MNIKVVAHKNKPRFARYEVWQNAENMYLFSDNAERRSNTKHDNPGKKTWYYEEFGEYNFPRKSSQRIRGLKNAYPITTIKDRNHTQWLDKDLEKFKEIIDRDIERIKNNQHKYKEIHITDKIFGDDALSYIRMVAPKCFRYLTKKLTELGIDNENLSATRTKEYMGGPNYKGKLNPLELHKKLII